MDPRSDFAIRAALEELLAERTSEGLYLDYKEEIDSRNRWELLEDICSFANTSGGTLILGIREARDETGAKLGYPGELLGIGKPAQEIRQLIEHSIRDCVQPRLPPIQIDEVPCFPKGSIFVISIPQSSGAPHLVCLERRMSCHYRNNHGKYPLDAMQLRTAFLHSRTLAERAEEFVQNRIAKFLDGRRPVAIRGLPCWHIHLVPEGSLLSEFSLDPKAVAQHRKSLITPEGSGRSPFPSIDGLVIPGNQYEHPNEFESYAMVFRDGCVEGATIGPFGKGDGPRYGMSDSEITFLASQVVLKNTVEFVHNYALLLQDLGASEGLLVTATLTNCRRVFLSEALTRHDRSPKRFGEDLVRLPFVRLDSFPDSPNEIAEALCQIFVTLAQAGGLWQSDYYDADGKCRLQF